MIKTNKLIRIREFPLTSARTADEGEGVSGTIMPKGTRKGELAKPKSKISLQVDPLHDLQNEYLPQQKRRREGRKCS